jgi:hypothetical protein
VTLLKDCLGKLVYGQETIPLLALIGRYKAVAILVCAINGLVVHVRKAYVGVVQPRCAVFGVLTYLHWGGKEESVYVIMERSLTCYEYLLFAYLVPKLEHLPCAIENITLAVTVDTEISEHLPTFVRLVDNGIATVIHILVLARAVCVAD